MPQHHNRVKGREEVEMRKMWACVLRFLLGSSSVSHGIYLTFPRWGKNTLTPRHVLRALCALVESMPVVFINNIVCVFFWKAYAQ